ncbi:MAG: hypothetical protein KIT74_06690 [Fimbriimonadales bacterium]|nr:hypothetical protein [Fimbriimonadales bacterium]
MLQNKLVSARVSGPESLNAMLEVHPGVEVESFEDSDGLSIEFKQGSWIREALAAHPSIEGPYGLVELMDNNPLVCADRASCPGPAATLALVGLGPLIRAGLVVERPSILFSFDADYEEVDAALAAMGWPDGATCAGDPIALGGVVSATCLSAIRIPMDAEEIDELFEEAYGRSFFVRRTELDAMNPDQLRGMPYAEYALALTEGEGGLGLLRVQVLADINGKCGAAQLVHLFNVMSGFEEDLGISN